MKLIKTFHEFIEKVGLLTDIQYSHGIPLEPCWGVLGLFEKHRLKELKEFIEKFPEYHIISTTEKFVYFNREMTDFFGYYLGEGDKDPEIIYAEMSDEEGSFDFEEKWKNSEYCWDPFNLKKHRSA